MTNETYHFIGIGGIGMSALARILLSKKIPVSGSDIAYNYVIEGLVKEGATIHKGHSADIISSHMTVVYGSDIKKDNPEYTAAIHLGCPLLHRSELLAKLSQEKRSFAVAGTHGKTTTSAMLATVLYHAKKDPSFAVGGILPEFHANSHVGKGEDFVLEADESDGTFLNYHPESAIVTNIDNDHLINFEGSEEVLIQAFAAFISQVKNSELLFWCGDDPHLKKLNLPGQKYGFSEECNWRATNFRQKEFRIFIDISGDGHIYKNVEISRIGRHNALNALAVFGLARKLGIGETIIRDALKQFTGVMRRCEFKGECNEIKFIDDYAHHPTEIKVTLKGLKDAVQEKRLIAVFQPHRYSRTQDCLGMYGSIFDHADELIITDIFSAGEEPIPHVTHEQIINEIRKSSTIPVHYVPRSALIHMLADFVRPHDVVATLGAGDITKVGAEILAYLEKNPPKKLKLGVIFGGASTEHEVSINSSKHFFDRLQAKFYQIEPIGITRQGSWLTGADVKERLEAIVSGKSKDPLTDVSADALAKIKECDVLIPVLHGTMGEDGTIQGMFEILKKAYVGCDHYSAAVCMNKVTSKKLVALKGIRTSPFVDFTHQQWLDQHDALLHDILTSLTFPLFVKPIHLGSSVGVKKVNTLDELVSAIENGFTLDTHILVENGIKGRELEFAILGNDRVMTFPPGEVFTHGGVYDYNAKYASDGMKTSPHASLPDHLIEEGKRLAESVYQALGCQGLTRVDFFLDEKGYCFNEANPIPGFTATSLYPQICAHNGLHSADLMDQFVILALSRKRKKDRIRVHETAPNK